MLDLSKPIKRADFETAETVILSGQIHFGRLFEIFRDNPEFARWYDARAVIRHGGTHVYA